MKFKLDGKEVLSMRSATVLPVPVRIVRWLESRPDGDMYTTKDLCMHAAVSVDRLNHLSSDPRLIPVCLRIPGKPLWWGSSKTITEARKELT
jgi:hypothetical protein